MSHIVEHCNLLLSFTEKISAISERNPAFSNRRVVWSFQGHQANFKSVRPSPRTHHSHQDACVMFQGLDWLLEAYPAAQLAFHEDEARFITGGGQYKDLSGDSLIFELGKQTQGVDSKRPLHRSLVLKVDCSSNGQ